MGGYGPMQKTGAGQFSDYASEWPRLVEWVGWGSFYNQSLRFRPFNKVVIFPSCAPILRSMLPYPSRQNYLLRDGLQCSTLSRYPRAPQPLCNARAGVWAPAFLLSTLSISYIAYGLVFSMWLGGNLEQEKLPAAEESNCPVVVVSKSHETMRVL